MKKRLLLAIIIEVSITSPWLSPIPILVLGFTLVVVETKDFFDSLSLSLAVGLPLLVIALEILSLFKIPLWWAIPILLVVSFFLFPRIGVPKPDLYDFMRLFIPLIILVIIHALLKKPPTDSVDSIFHAYKIKQMLLQNTVFPQTPFQSVIRYPYGYHTFVEWILLLHSQPIPNAMMIARLWTWIFLLLGTFFCVKTWFGKKEAFYSILFFPFTLAYTHYLLKYVHPNFLGFYFFLSSLGTYRLYKDSKIRPWIPFVVLIGTAIVHPYEFQLAVFIIFIRELVDGGNFILRTAKFVIPPFLAFLVLDPYFLTPRVILSGSSLKPAEWWKFWDTLKWFFVRDGSLLGTAFALSSLIRLKKNWKDYVPIVILFPLILLLALDKLTIKLQIPFYGKASMVRTLLWMIPLIPPLMGVGAVELLQLSKGKRTLTAVFVVLIGTTLIVQAPGVARLYLSDEMLYYVTQTNLNDFRWLEEEFPNSTVLNSCYTDSGQWIPFYTSDKVVFTYLNKCRWNNMTPFRVQELLKEGINPGFKFVYIDTNYPSLDPLLFYNFKLLRVNGEDWIYAIQPSKKEENFKVLKKALYLRRNYISGNIFEDGRFYIFGFLHKNFAVEYYHLLGLDAAWLKGEKGIIAFVPSRNYSTVKISIIALGQSKLEVCVNGGRCKTFIINGAEDILLDGSIVKDKLSVLEFRKRGALVLIKRIELKN